MARQRSKLSKHILNLMARRVKKSNVEAPREFQILRQLNFGDECRLKNKVNGEIIYGRYFGYGKALAKMGNSEYRSDEASPINRGEKVVRKRMPEEEELRWQKRSWERSLESNKVRRQKVNENNYGKSIKMRWEERQWIKSYQQRHRDLAWILYRGWEKDLAWRSRYLWVVCNPSHRRFLRCIITYCIVLYCESPESSLVPKRIQISRPVRYDGKKVLPAEYLDSSGFEKFVMDRLVEQRKWLKGLKDFSKTVSDETLMKELGIRSKRRFRDLKLEGYIKSNQKEDVVDFIAQREIDPNKPGRKVKK